MAQGDGTAHLHHLPRHPRRDGEIISENTSTTGQFAVVTCSGF